MHTSIEIEKNMKKSIERVEFNIFIYQESLVFRSNFVMGNKTSKVCKKLDYFYCKFASKIVFAREDTLLR